MPAWTPRSSSVSSRPTGRSAPQAPRRWGPSSPTSGRCTHAARSTSTTSYVEPSTGWSATPASSRDGASAAPPSSSTRPRTPIGPSCGRGRRPRGPRAAGVWGILGVGAALPGLRRVDLVVNRRCPAPVVARASRLVEHNEERFAKRILSRPGAGGELVLPPDPADDPARARRLLTAWAPALHAPDASTHAVLARTNVELAPYAAAALELGLQYRAEIDGLDLLDDPAVDRVLAQVEAGTEPPLVP